MNTGESGVGGVLDDKSSSSSSSVIRNNIDIFILILNMVISSGHFLTFCILKILANFSEETVNLIRIIAVAGIPCREFA